VIVLAGPRLGFHGGVERHVHDLAVGLRARGHRVALAHAPLVGRDPERYARAFDAVETLDRSASVLREARAVYAHKVEDEAWLDRVPKGARLTLAVHDHDLTCVRSHRYVPLTNAPCERAPGVTCAAHGCVVVRCPTARFGVAVRDPFALIQRTRNLARRAPMVACSAFLRRTMIDAGVAAERVRTLNPVPPEDTSPLVPPTGEPVVGFVGQIVRGKGLDLLIEAIARIPAAKLVVAGAGNGLDAERRRIERLGLSSRVELLGAVDPSQVRAVYDRVRVIAVPSRWPEPFGMIGVEAMRRGRVVVGARHGGIPEWLDDGVTGIAFRPGDVGELAAALSRALFGSSYEALAAAAHARAHARFSFARMLDEVENALGVTAPPA
jgi:glycosyltransferase involved in cell wall biosynthesis